MVRRLAAQVVLALSIVLVPAAVGASATEPISVAGSITDHVAAVDSERDEIQAAIDDLYDARGIQLFVVYVDDFGGLTGAEWAEQSSELSGIAGNDVLLAIAVTERAYGIDTAEAVSDRDLERISRDFVLPELRQSRWAAAAIAAADGIDQVAETDGVGWQSIAAASVVVAGTGTGLWYLNRRRKLDRGDTGELSTEQLEHRAGTALVAIDDALSTSEAELGFALAQFGEQATEAFEQAITHGHDRVAEAFALRQQLDDDVPESDADRRQIAESILAICAEVDAALDEQVEQFDSLRDLHATVPDLLESLERRATEVAARIEPAQATIDALARSYPATSLASLSANASHAAELIAATRLSITSGQTALEADDRHLAVAHARAAEDALSHSVTLLSAVDHADTDLQASAGRISEQLASIGSDLDDAARLGAGNVAIESAAAVARAAVAYAQLDERDPLAAITQLDEAEAQLDDLLDPLRAAAAEAEKQRQALRDLLGRVSSQVKSAADFIQTRRGAIGPEPRTRLSEAARHLDRGQRLVDTDPAESLAALQKAEQYAQSALELAQREIRDWERSRASPSSGGGLESMILGGILVNSGRKRGNGWASGGGGFGGSAPRRSPGSFGGSSTRTRRSTGGRF